MDKSLKTVLFIFALGLYCILLSFIYNHKIHKLQKKLIEYENAKADTSTTTQQCTVFIDNPNIIAQYESEKEQVAIEMKKLRKQLAIALNTPNDTSFIHDTTIKEVYLPREYKVYADSNYRAVVSGVEPRLDSMQVYNKTITTTITKTIIKTKPLKPYISLSGATTPGSNIDVLGGASVGVVVKDKIGFQFDYKHSFKHKQEYIGGSVLLFLGN